VSVSGRVRQENYINRKLASGRHLDGTINCARRVVGFARHLAQGIFNQDEFP